jgi:DNA polymerase epsilon subunit 1
MNRSYGGILAKNSVQNDENIPSTPLQQTSETPAVEMHWHINQYLPPFIQPTFLRIVAEFILKRYEFKLQQRLESHIDGQTPAKGMPANISISQVQDKDGLVLEERKLVREYFSRKLLKIIPEIQQRISMGAETEQEQLAISFPQLPGSHLKMNNPPLELIKYICQVFGIAQELEYQVRIMRRSLLQLIGIREFSPESQYECPSESLVLPHVFCTFCQHCRDVDLATDADIIAMATAMKERDMKQRQWLQCPQCHHDHDQAMMEESLVNMVQRIVIAFQLRDLYCTKCRLTKVENLREHCKSCAGEYVVATGTSLSQMSQSSGDLTMGDVEALKRRLRLLQNIGRMYTLPFLAETVDFALTLL